MSIAGMYESSGDWLLDVGAPGKSDISGGVLVVSPGKGALGVFSPPLDTEGNSVRGQLVARFLARELGLDVLGRCPRSSAAGRACRGPVSTSSTNGHGVRPAANTARRAS